MIQCTSDIWSTYCVHMMDGACSIEVHASRWEVLDPAREAFDFKLS
jgi:hypothetical protein